MSKQLPLIAGGIVILVVIGIVAFLQMGKKSSSSNAPTATSAQSESSVSSTSGTLKDLFSGGKTVNCKFSYPDNSMSGNVFVSGGKVRNEFTTTKDGKTTDGTVIYDGTYAYFWSSSSSQAIKYKMGSIEDMQKQAQGQAQTMDLSQKVNFDCSNWSVDNSKFVPPSNIQFTDFTEMMMKVQASPATGGTNGNSMKSACSAISDPSAKAACEKYAQ